LRFVVRGLLAPTLEVNLRLRGFLAAALGVDDLDMIPASRYAAIVAVDSTILPRMYPILEVNPTNGPRLDYRWQSRL
jgi:hypothetical protein